MAKKGSRGDGPSKTKLILDYKSNNPDAKPKEISSALKSQHGVSALPGFVSTILSNARRKQGLTKNKKGRPASSGLKGGNVSYDAIVDAKKLIHEAGGIEQAKRLIDALSGL